MCHNDLISIHEYGKLRQLRMRHEKLTQKGLTQTVMTASLRQALIDTESEIHPLILKLRNTVALLR